MDIDGKYYRYLKSLPNPYGSGSKYKPEDLGCIQRTLAGLEDNQKSGAPGLLLGKIQSGKTKSFIGLIALAFDNGYDLVVVLTKNSEALTGQTVSRLKGEFSRFKKSIHVKDIISVGGVLKKDLAESKLILVCKKQHQNLDYVISALSGDGSHFKEKKVLIIDDEADNASVSFSGSVKGKEAADLKKVAGKIDQLRRAIRTKPSFLQVTATPYSLLMQNKGSSLRSDPKTKSLRPSFVELVPVHRDYFGGDHYFGEIARDVNKPESLMHKAVSDDEMKLLRNQNSVSLGDVVLKSGLNPFPSLTMALSNFLVGGVIRRIQQQDDGVDEEYISSYAMLMHTEANKRSHLWQSHVVQRLLALMRDCAAMGGGDELDGLLKSSYDDLANSLNLETSDIPAWDRVRKGAMHCLTRGGLRDIVVNSDEDVSSLLDAVTGELLLEADLTVFIAGQYMDRGVTVPNLISFFYGRSPKAFQQDTVLQHCRMFGSRLRPEVAVTRFYTTTSILSVLQEMHENDTILRRRIETHGVSDDVVQFLRRGSSKHIKLCSFDKIRASRIRVIDRKSKLWPRGFTLKSASALNAITLKVDDIIEGHGVLDGVNGNVMVDAEDAIEILKDVIRGFASIAPEYQHVWNVDEVCQLMLHLSDKSAGRSEANSGKVLLVVRFGRTRPNQFARGQLPLDSPDNPEEDTEDCRKLAAHTPVLLLTRQEGRKSDSWDDKPFWWPVFFPPFDNNCYMYAAD